MTYQTVFQVIALLIALALLAFWLWMFQDMTNNDYIPASASTPLSWPPTTKYAWTLAFIFLSVFAALYYYLIEYRYRHL